LPKPWKKLIVALDITSEKRAKQIISALAVKKPKFKIGLIAYTSFGPKIIDWVKTKGGSIFLDFKLYDIPNTMVETAKAFVDLGVWAFTVHVKAGEESLKILKKEITAYSRKQKKPRPLIIGVTELTSRKTSLKSVLSLAKIAKKSKIDGVVSSVWEAKKIAKDFKLLTITPGIRKKKTNDDQKRVATVKDALREGSSFFVVGRPIINEKNCLFAAEELLK